VLDIQVTDACATNFVSKEVCPHVNYDWQAEAKTIKLEDWEQKLAGVTVRKEDMNKLVMNFLVTEVRLSAC
jgi:hypothetical protein